MFKSQNQRIVNHLTKLLLNDTDHTQSTPNNKVGRNFNTFTPQSSQ